MVTMDDISNAIILLVRVGAVARFVYCLVRLTAAEEQAAPATITIPLQDAEALYQMLRNVELAELHFHSCQAANFRQHVQATFHAQDVADAYETLKDAIEKAKEV